MTPGCQRALFMANYNSCGWPLIPAHVAVTYGILPIDDDLTSSNSETEHDEVDTLIYGTCVIILLIDLDIMYIMYTCLTSIS